MGSKTSGKFKDLHFAKVDLDRLVRRGFPEVIYAKGKSIDQIAAIAEVLRNNGHAVVITKVDSKTAQVLRKRIPWVESFSQAQILAGPFSKKNPARKGWTNKKVLVVTAGTSDIPVAEEAIVTLRLMGRPVKTLFDVGVAGLHRLLSYRRLLRQARVIVVVAGMDGALPSVISGLVNRPVVAVPTSVGYGASFKGVAPLLAMLNSCSPGVAVLNIDNGFGAGYLAAMIACSG